MSASSPVLLDDKDRRLHALRDQLIHVLAVDDLPTDILSQGLDCKEDEVLQLLQIYAYQRVDPSMWQLKDKAFRMLDIWRVYADDHTRNIVISRARTAFNRMRVSKHDKLWDQLLPPHQREDEGAQGSLSRLSMSSFEPKASAPVPDRPEYQQSLEDDSDSDSDSNSSEKSSYPRSVASITSGVSSVTSLPSKYSTEELRSAAEELVDLLAEDEVLKPLYKASFEDQAIGAERFGRNFRRLLLIYAGSLKYEAQEPLHEEAAKLVRSRAPYVTNCIRVKFEMGHGNMFQRIQPLGSPLSRQARQEQLERFLAQTASMDQSHQPTAPEDIAPIEDESEADEKIEGSDLTNLTSVKAFLISGRPFDELRENFKQFVRPSTSSRTVKAAIEQGQCLLKSGVEGDEQSDALAVVGTTACKSGTEISKPSLEIPTAIGRHWLHSIFDFSVSLLDFGLPFDPSCRQIRETKLGRGKVRIRWTCQCGAVLWDDFKELRPGPAEELRKNLQSFAGEEPPARPKKANFPTIRPFIVRCFGNLFEDFLTSKIQIPNSLPGRHGNRVAATNSSGSQSVNQGAVVGLPNSSSTSASGSGNGAGGSAGPLVPANAIPGQIYNTALAAPASLSSHKKWLLLCYRKRNDTHRLRQLDIANIKNDVQLFELLQSTYLAQKGRLASWLSPRKLVSVDFRKVNSLLFSGLTVYRSR